MCESRRPRNGRHQKFNKMNNDVQVAKATTVNAANAASVNAEYSAGVKSVKRTRSKSKSPFDAVLEKARSTFNVQLDRSPKTKREAIEKALSAQSASYTKEQFLSEYVSRTARLLDSKRYCKECQSLKLDPFTIATHVAFDGVRRTQRVIEKEVKDEYSDLFQEMKEPVYDLKTLTEFDTLKMLSDAK